MNCILNTLKSEVIRQNRILADENAAQMNALQKAELAKIDEIYSNVQKIYLLQILRKAILQKFWVAELFAGPGHRVGIFWEYD